MTNTTEETNDEPDECGEHTRVFDLGGQAPGFEGFVSVVSGDMERLANRVGRPCEINVRIEVRDLDDGE